MKPVSQRPRSSLLGIFLLAAAFATLLFVLLVPKWDHPWDPIESRDWGWRGIAMNTFTSARTRNDPINLVPAATAPFPDSGIAAGEVYENIEVLSDLDSAQFDYLMQAMTEWVAPEEGCSYCHKSGESFASDDLYTKQVARRMLEMVRDVNTNARHVGNVGITCFTCHRGNNVPPKHWYKGAPPEPPMGGIVGKPPPWNRTATTMRDFFPRAPFENYLLDDQTISGAQARAVSGEVAEIADLENIYILMMQMSDGMGVNCTFCHNTRAFADWSQSTPNRVNAWYGIRMSRRINRDYLTEMQGLFPPNRLGPLGDVAKVDCATCHNGMSRPLGGERMAERYRGLFGPGSAVAPTRATAFETRKAHQAVLTQPGVDERAVTLDKE